jgi:hypothetical protein
MRAMIILNKEVGSLLHFMVHLGWKSLFHRDGRTDSLRRYLGGGQGVLHGLHIHSAHQMRNPGPSNHRNPNSPSAPKAPQLFNLLQETIGPAKRGPHITSHHMR